MSRRAGGGSSMIVLAGLGLAGGPARAEVSDWRLDAAHSRIEVHVAKKGVLSPVLHNHVFVARSWSGRLRFDPARPEALALDVRLRADSLVDEQPELSPADRARVEAQVRSPAVLDAARFPTIRFEARSFAPSPLRPVMSAAAASGTLEGVLTLHGRTRALRLPVSARIAPRSLEANGTVTFRQSDFGIKPYRKALGTIGVEDRVTVVLYVRAAPTASPLE